MSKGPISQFMEKNYLHFNAAAMMDAAKQSAENLEKDFISSEKKLTEAKEKLAAAEREAANAKKKSDQAKTILEQAVNHWKKASDDLANEWGKSEVK